MCYYCLQLDESTTVPVGLQYIGVRLSHIIFLNHEYIETAYILDRFFSNRRCEGMQYFE